MCDLHDTRRDLGDRGGGPALPGLGGSRLVTRRMSLADALPLWVHSSRHQARAGLTRTLPTRAVSWAADASTCARELRDAGRSTARRSARSAPRWPLGLSARPCRCRGRARCNATRVIPPQPVCNHRLPGWPSCCSPHTGPSRCDERVAKRRRRHFCASTRAASTRLRGCEREPEVGSRPVEARHRRCCRAGWR
jgi:hypothetical protein